MAFLYTHTVQVLRIHHTCQSHVKIRNICEFSLFLKKKTFVFHIIVCMCVFAVLLCDSDPPNEEFLLNEKVYS